MSYENRFYQPQCPVKYMGDECQLDKGHVSNIHVGKFSRWPRDEDEDGS